MLQGFNRALSGKPVETPKNHHIKFAATGGCKHGLKLLPVAMLATYAVNVLRNYLPPLFSAKHTQLEELIGNVLSLVLCADRKVRLSLK